MPELINMAIVIVMDFLVNSAYTETKLPVKLQKDFEIYAHVPDNMAVAFLASSAGYMQLKFNGIKHGVTGNIKNRRIAGLPLHVARNKTLGSSCCSSRCSLVASERIMETGEDDVR